ncbi:hypothetical protein GBF38_007711 [Nibea albiflora]|uniref:Uncharacterized protein n=1 Tax=Nibea albiflora TaxID=240163 RepID=A0ACB7ENQ6_NIBAL|nr:hypothetical protein GBF38_007711 [Nibea albiflora]
MGYWDIPEGTDCVEKTWITTKLGTALEGSSSEPDSVPAKNREEDNHKNFDSFPLREPKQMDPNVNKLLAIALGNHRRLSMIAIRMQNVYAPE